MAENGSAQASQMAHDVHGIPKTARIGMYLTRRGRRRRILIEMQQRRIVARVKPDEDSKETTEKEVLDETSDVIKERLSKLAVERLIQL